MPRRRRVRAPAGPAARPPAAPNLGSISGHLGPSRVIRPAARPLAARRRRAGAGPGGARAMQPGETGRDGERACLPQVIFSPRDLLPGESGSPRSPSPRPNPTPTHALPVPVPVPVSRWGGSPPSTTSSARSVRRSSPTGTRCSRRCGSSCAPRRANRARCSSSAASACAGSPARSTPDASSRSLPRSLSGRPRRSPACSTPDAASSSSRTPTRPSSGCSRHFLDTS